MALRTEPLDELRNAYRLLDGPPPGTAHLIRQRHRQLLKRWHPDLYHQGSPQHAEATQMSKLINEAYSRIRSAPLRYASEPVPQPAESATLNGSASHTLDPDENYPRLDRIEFWVRFVCGGLLGTLVGAEVMLYAFAVRIPDWLVILVGV